MKLFSIFALLVIIAFVAGAWSMGHFSSHEQQGAMASQQALNTTELIIAASQLHAGKVEKAINDLDQEIGMNLMDLARTVGNRTGNGKFNPEMETYSLAKGYFLTYHVSPRSEVNTLLSNVSPLTPDHVHYVEDLDRSSTINEYFSTRK